MRCDVRSMLLVAVLVASTLWPGAARAACTDSPPGLVAWWGGDGNAGDMFGTWDGTLVGDARFLLLKNMPTREERRELLEEVRVLALTAPIPNDVCCVRRGFPPDLSHELAGWWPETDEADPDLF